MIGGKKYLKESIYLLSLLIIILALICHFSQNKNNKNEFISFETPFLPLPDPNSIRSQVEDKTFIRKFSWKNPKEKQVTTTLHISRAAHKNELKNFGVSPAFNHPRIIEKKGFKIVNRRNVMVKNRITEKVYSIVDYKKVFNWSLSAFPPITKELLKSVQLPTDVDPLHYLLAFVQWIKYQRPPKYFHSKFINNFFTPLVCLFEQYGDCDTKSLLLAEFLFTIDNRKEKTMMILIKQPGLSHAILAIKRAPFPGMTSLFFPGRGYFVVLESSAPGWAPGFVSKRILEALKSGRYGWVEF